MRKGNVWYLCKALEYVWSFSNTHPSVSDGPRQPVAQCYGWSILSAASDAAPSRVAVQILPLSSAEHLNTVFQLRAKDAVSISLFIYLYENRIPKLLLFSLALKLIIKPTLLFCDIAFTYEMYIHTLNKLTVHWVNYIYTNCFVYFWSQNKIHCCLWVSKQHIAVASLNEFMFLNKTVNYLITVTYMLFEIGVFEQNKWLNDSISDSFQIT